MSTTLNNWRKHRKEIRTRRAIEAAMNRSTGPAMRDELLTLANREGISVNR